MPSEYRHELKPADAVDALQTILTSLSEIESIDDAQVIDHVVNFTFYIALFRFWELGATEITVVRK